MKNVIIVAGGNGTRMGSEIPKQFLPLAGKPILMHTIEKFYDADPETNIIIVLPSNQITYWQSLCQMHNFSLRYQMAIGGDTRYQSVKNGLQLIEAGIVAVHDAVRPFISKNLINTLFSEAKDKGNAIPAIDLSDSIREIEGKQSKGVDRTRYKSIQTPQCFSSEVILKAYDHEYRSTFTDDASVVEFGGFMINLVPGETSNIKITTPTDLKIAECLLGN